jgi:hypothetical protein
MFEGWTKDEKGDAIAYPLAGHEIVIYAQTGILLRLEYLNPGDRLDTPTGSVQLVMKPDGAKPLVQDLLKAIAQIERQSGRPAN